MREIVATQAVVIASLKYSEADLIVKCYTKSQGLKSYLLRNILSSKSKKIRASMFQPLTQLEIITNHNDKNNLHHIREARVINPYKSLQIQIDKSSIALFLAEVLRNSIQEEEANPGLYAFLDENLEYLDKQHEIVNFHLLFLLKLTRYLGFYPHAFYAGENVFNLLEGVFQEKPTNEYCIEKENVSFLKQLMGMGFGELSKLQLNQSQRMGLLETLLLYYELHLQGFRKPKSLEVLNAVFA